MLGDDPWSLIEPTSHDLSHVCVQVSYMILQRVSPVTHSIGNCLKRVIVIVASVLVFHNPMSRQNMIGASLVALQVPIALRTGITWRSSCDAHYDARSRVTIAWPASSSWKGWRAGRATTPVMTLVPDIMLTVVTSVRRMGPCSYFSAVLLRILLCAGTGVALAGVFAYSQVKRLQTSKPKAV